MQIAFGFAASKALLSAVEIGLFSALAKAPGTVEEISGRVGLHPRSARDFLDTLVSLGLLERTNGHYRNTDQAGRFLDRAQPYYIGGILEMMNARLYTFWGSLTEALRTGRPQNETKNSEDFFGALYSDPDRLRAFLSAMTAFSMPSAKAIAAKFPWRDYRSVIDVGAAQGGVPVQIALAHPHLCVYGYDLPPVRPVFEEYVRSNGIADRVEFLEGNFLEEPLPSADVLVMGHILHDWGMDDKRRLLDKAYTALPQGGALIVYESLIDDERRANTLGLLMSLNMLIETPAGFDYTAADCKGWMREAGFRRTYSEHLAGPESMVVGVK